MLYDGARLASAPRLDGRVAEARGCGTSLVGTTGYFFRRPAILATHHPPHFLSFHRSTLFK